MSSATAPAHASRPRPRAAGFTDTLRGEIVRTSAEPYYEAEDKQGDVVDRTDGVQKDIARS